MAELVANLGDERTSLLCPQHARFEEKFDNIEVTMMEIKEWMKEFQKDYARRLPTWATALISFLTLILGAALVALFRKEAGV